MKTLKRLTVAAALVLVSVVTVAQVSTPLRPVHVEGRHLVDDQGHCVNMRGVMYGPHPFFNNGAWGSGWSDTAVENCLAYFDKVFTAITDTTQGSYVNMWRVPWEEYWCVTPNVAHTGTDVSTWDEAMALKYLDKLFIPLIEDAVSKGLYVVLRPTYGNPGDIQVGDNYQKHLEHEWKLLASHPRLQALSGYVSFELLNEPTRILDEDSTESDAALTKYMQPMIDTIRANGFDGVIWSSGLAFQTDFRGYVKHPLHDSNLGYAVHIYPSWFSQSDDNADGERLLSAFHRMVPVVDDSPIVITEVDWSPVKEGEGRVNEFGEWIPSNYGSWGTGSTSKWGKAFKYLLEYEKNISVSIGSADEYFDITQYLKDGTFKVGFDGNPECSSEAAYEWYNDWAHRPAQTPAKRDRLTEEVLGKTKFTTIGELTDNLFQIVQGSGKMLYINSEDAGGWDMLYGTASSIVNSNDKAYLFKAHPVDVDGKTYYTLKCYYPDGTLRMSGLDGGCADGVNVTTGANPVLFIGSTRTNGPHNMGQDLDYGGLWEIKAKNGGFTFQSISDNNKYIGPSGQSAAPTVWNCYSRYSFLAGDSIRYQRVNDTQGGTHTVCLPYNATFAGCDVYEVAGVDSKDNPTRLYLSKTSDNQTLAGRAYVLIATGDGDINANMATLQTKGWVYSSAPLTGSFKTKQVAAGDYVLRDGQWLQAKDDSTFIKPYRAYLNIAKAQEVTDGDMVMTLQDVTDGIAAITGPRQNSETTRVYNLCGQQTSLGKVGQKHGIFIVRGKKVVQ